MTPEEMRAESRKYLQATKTCGLLRIADYQMMFTLWGVAAELADRLDAVELRMSNENKGKEELT